MESLFCVDTFIPAYLGWLVIRLVGFHEPIRLWH
jgi:hypothetical protein